eukprot:7236121-Prymnesium_polylepis.1
MWNVTSSSSSRFFGHEGGIAQPTGGQQQGVPGGGSLQQGRHVAQAKGARASASKVLRTMFCFADLES